MRQTALFRVLLAAAFCGQPCECQYDIWHAIDEQMVICDPLPEPNPLPAPLTTWPFSKQEFPVQIAYDHGLDEQKPHVVTFIREFKTAVNITYDVKDAKGTIVVNRRTDKLGGSVTGDCTCTGNNGGRLPSGYDKNYGTSCGAWDNANCAKTAGVSKDKTGKWCCQPWCYVPETCPDAYMATINQGAYFSYGACNEARRKAKMPSVTIPAIQKKTDVANCKYSQKDPCECINVGTNPLFTVNNSVATYGADYGSRCFTWDEENCNDETKIPPHLVDSWCCSSWCWIRSKECINAIPSTMWPGLYWGWAGCPADSVKMNQCPFTAKVEAPAARRRQSGRRRTGPPPTDPPSSVPTPAPVAAGLCDCLGYRPASMGTGRRRAGKAWAANYGATCDAWDKDFCAEYFPKAERGIWCCQSWCWVDKACPGGKESMIAMGYYWSFTACNQKGKALRECKYSDACKPSASLAPPYPGGTSLTLLQDGTYPNVTISADYGNYCSAWDTGDGSASRNCFNWWNGSAYWNDPPAKNDWCCEKWAFVNETCPVALEGAGGASYSYIVCEDLVGANTVWNQASKTCTAPSRRLEAPKVAWEEPRLRGAAKSAKYDTQEELGDEDEEGDLEEDEAEVDYEKDEEDEERAGFRRAGHLEEDEAEVDHVEDEEEDDDEEGDLEDDEEKGDREEEEEEEDEDHKEDEEDEEDEEEGDREEGDQEEKHEGPGADESHEEDSTDAEDNGEDEAGLDKDADVETSLDKGDKDAEARALSARRRAASYSARRRSPTYSARRRQPSRVSNGAGRRRMPPVVPDQRRRQPANTATARRRQTYSAADSGRRRGGTVGAGSTASSRRRGAAWSQAPTPRRRQAASVPDGRRRGAAATAPTPAPADPTIHRRRTSPPARRRLPANTPPRRRTASPRRRQTVAQAQGRRRQPAAVTASRRRQVGAGGRTFSTSRRRQPAGTPTASPTADRRRQNYAATNTQMLNSNYNNKPPLKTDSGFTGPSKPAGSNANVMMAGAAGLAGGALLGAGAYYAYSRWNSDGKTGTNPTDYQWCEIPEGESRGRMSRCDDCNAMYSSKCEPQQACYSGNSCDYKLPAQTYRDELYTAGFVPAEFHGPLTITVYEIKGSGFDKATYCPGPVPDTNTIDQNWIKAASVNANLFVTLQETNFVPVEQSCDIDTRSKCSTSAECGKNEQCPSDGYCECKPGWCLTDDSVKGITLPSCNKRQSGSGGKASTANFATVQGGDGNETNETATTTTAAPSTTAAPTTTLSCDIDTRSKCSTSAECGKNEQCQWGGYCECKPGWCLTDDSVKGITLPSCNKRQSGSGGKASTANFATVQATGSWPLILCLLAMTFLFRRRLL